MSPMDVFYINLERDTARNAAFTESFRDSGFSADWRLHRFTAITGDSDLAREAPGTLAPNLKANYLSHMECIRRSREHDNHALIAEDDTEFCEQTPYCIERCLASLPEDSWDVLLTDFYVMHAVDMPMLLELRRQNMARNVISLVDAPKWPGIFVGAGAYIVNRRSKDKLLGALQLTELDHNYDIMLRHVMCERRVRGILTFPFLATVSEHADASNNSPTEDSVSLMILRHLFRRLVWIGARDPTPLRERAERLFAEPLGADMAALGAIMIPMLRREMQLMAFG